MQTYLEYTEESGSGHKFYEARVDDCILTLRYGRIGTDGQTQVKPFATPEAAQAEALKKLAEKRKKGYLDAVLGEREKRDIPHPTLRLPKALAPYRATLEATIRPYVRLKGVRTQAQLWTSKLGGVPYRPLGAAWPLSWDGHPLAFLAQLNFAELPVLPGFPAEGIVQFFVRDNEFYGANFHSGFDMVSLADDANFRVLYHAVVEQDKARLETAVPTYRPDPDGSGLPHDPAREFVLHGELLSGPVTSGDRLFEHLVGESLWNFTEELSEDEEEALLKRYAHLAGEGHKLGGYPNFTQQDPRQPEDPHVLLFQLDSDDDLDVMWGDVGIANFFIPPDDLARAEFSRVVYHWDCS